MKIGQQAEQIKETVVGISTHVMSIAVDYSHVFFVFFCSFNDRCTIAP